MRKIQKKEDGGIAMKQMKTLETASAADIPDLESENQNLLSGDIEVSDHFEKRIRASYRQMCLDLVTPLALMILALVILVAVISPTDTIGGINFDGSLEQNPNFVFITVDNLGWIGRHSDLSPAIPFLTKLSDRGIRVAHYYTQEASTPSRSAFLTGRYPINTGSQYGLAEPNIEWALSPHEILLPEILKKSGYGTYMVGRWHLGHWTSEYLPTARGFDDFVGPLTDRRNHPELEKFHDLTYADDVCYAPYNTSNMYKHPILFSRDKAINVIKRHDYSSPMFLTVSMEVEYEDAFISDVYKNHLPPHTYNKIMTSIEGRERQQYALSLALVDDAVERIFTAIKAVSQMSNTYIIVT